MEISKFDYHLPEALIASTPSKQRSHSKLLLPSDGKNDAENKHRIIPFYELPGQIQAGDLLVFNDTKVIPARIYARKPTGGKAEIFLERLTDTHQALVQVRANKAVKSGTSLIVFDKSGKETGVRLNVINKPSDFFLIEHAEGQALLPVFEEHGHVPLPPYIERQSAESDVLRYQTVYARESGAVAAPTAGLHFDDALLQDIKAKGVDTAFVTLHVGAGTFQPVRVENIQDHKMHAERFSISAETIAKIRQTRETGGRVIAVGTTTVRALETFATELLADAGVKNPDKSVFDDTENELLPGLTQRNLQAFESAIRTVVNTKVLTKNADYNAESQIFIYPGYAFKLTDGLITNFHLPRSTLIMMVCAFAGYDEVMQAYEYAVEQKLRFYSYGDAMLLWKK